MFLPQKEELLAIGNPFSGGDPRKEGRLISHWDDVMWNDDYDSHGRSGASALGRSATLSSGACWVTSIPENSCSANEVFLPFDSLDSALFC